MLVGGNIYGDIITQPSKNRIGLFIDSDKTSINGLSFVLNGLTLYKIPITKNNIFIYAKDLFTKKSDIPNLELLIASIE